MSHKYLDDFLKMDVASKWVKPHLQNFLCFLSIIMANFSENLVTIASIFPLSMALLDQGYWSPYIGMAWFLLFGKKNQRVIVRPWLMSKKYTLLTFKGICMIFLLEVKNFILSHPVTSKKPHEIVQILMRHPVEIPWLML